MNEKPTVLMAGGGTAGHVNPLLATASYLAKDYEIKVLGTDTGLEKDLIPAAGYELLTIEKVPFPRSISKELLLFPGRMCRSYKQVKRWLQLYNIKVVVGFGGYVSTPAYLAALSCRVPVVVHEQNARPGLANKLGARWAKVVALTFKNTNLKGKRGITKVVGLPLRPQIQKLAEENTNLELKKQRRKEACQEFGFSPKKPVLLITGGSLGAAKINQAFCESICKLPDEIQVLHLSGKGKSAEIHDALCVTGDNSSKRHYQVREYLLEMEKAFACADLVVGRSGAGAVSEITALGIPAIYVPFPIGNGEQRLNAEPVVKAGGARLIKNEDFQATTVLEQVIPLLNDKVELAKMSANTKTLAFLDASKELVKLIKEQIK